MNCKVCNCVITDPDFAAIWYQEEYPTIDIGPYCEQCMGKIKVCSGCQHPFLYTEVTHTGNGDHFCAGCLANLEICSHCNSQTNSDSLQVINGQKVCSKCISKKYFKCPICEEYHEKNSGISKESLLGQQRLGIFRKYGPRVCESCYDKKKKHFKFYDVGTCDNCGNLYAKGVGSHDKYCPNCWDSFYTCADCGQKKPNISSHYMDEEVEGAYKKRLCNSCHSKYTTCDSCKKLTKQPLNIKGEIKSYKVCSCCKSVKECKNCGTIGLEDYCSKCNKMYIKNTCGNCGRIKDHDCNCRACGHSYIYSYSLKPAIFLNYNKEKETKRDNIFFGFENEVSFGTAASRDKSLKLLYETFDPTVLIAKSDSSLPPYSYEIVSQPMTLKFFNTLDFKRLLPKALKASDRCGLHIHVGRKAFLSDVHLYKVINFIHDNLVFSQKVAGRELNRYCEQLGSKTSEHVKRSKEGDTGRHKMVNLNPRDTVEFRLFAGCTEEGELRSRVEFLHALINFCKGVSIREAKSVEKFVEYLGKNKKTYMNALTLCLEVM